MDDENLGPPPGAFRSVPDSVLIPSILSIGLLGVTLVYSVLRPGDAVATIFRSLHTGSVLPYVAIGLWLCEVANTKRTESDSPTNRWITAGFVAYFLVAIVSGLLLVFTWRSYMLV